MMRSFRHRVAAAIGCLGCLGYLLFFSGLLAFSASLAPAPRPTAQIVSAPAAPAPTAVPTVAQAVAPAPTAATEPTQRPIIATLAARSAAKPASEPKPTATPAPPPLAIAFTGEFEPKLLKVGQKLVVKLGIENKSERPIEGLRIFSSGPWAKFTVASVLPGGRLESGLLGFNIYSPMTVPPGQTRFINIVAYPNEPGNHDFTFIPNRDTEALKDTEGKGIVIGGTVAVTR